MMMSLSQALVSTNNAQIQLKNGEIMTKTELLRKSDSTIIVEVHGKSVFFRGVLFFKFI